jgi:hypothetical protein
MNHTTAAGLVNEGEQRSRSLQGPEVDQTHATIVSVLVGSIIGWFMGIAQLIYIGSWEFFYWPFVSMIPLYSALGGALYGMIIGASGVFSKSKLAEDESEGAHIRSDAA